MTPALIVIGGFAGAGKTAISKRLSAELQIPRLGSDTIGRTIKTSMGSQSQVNAFWIAYEVLFRLCEEFIQARIPTILDLTMGWEFQWQHLDGITRRHPQVLFLPIILRCPYDECIKRIRQRYKANPEYYDSPEIYMTDQKNISIREYLAKLDRPDIYFVDASRHQNEVYEEILAYFSSKLTGKQANAVKNS